MKNFKLFTLILAVTILALTATACDAATLEQLQAAGLTPNDDSVDTPESQSTSRDGSSGNELKAIITDVTATTITFGGVTYTVDTAEDLTALLVPGQGYEIEFNLNPDGSITLLRFDLDDSLFDGDDDGDVEVKVLVTEVTANTLTFDGVTYTINTTEDLTTLFTAGLGYEIEYIQNADGTITLLDFHFEDDLSDDDGDDMNDDDMDDDDMDDDNDNNGINSDNIDDDNNLNNNDNNNNDNNNNNNNNNDDNNN